MEFLGYTVTTEGVYMQKRLMNAIRDWPTPKTVRQVQQFIGLANFYRRFIRGYAKIIQPVADLVRKNSFRWGNEQEDAFVNLKTALTSAPVLAHPQWSKKFTVSTDASKYAVGAALEQDGHPVAFLSHRLSNAESKWDTGDQELLAFMIALREWDVYLRGRHFLFKTDHEPIRYLQSKSRLTGRQARWLDEIQSYSFDVEHVPGVKHVVPDALSRRPDHNPQPQLHALSIQDSGLLARISAGYTSDGWANVLLATLRDGKPPPSEKVQRQIPNYKYSQNVLYWTGGVKPRVYIPNTGDLRSDIISGFHNTGHLGTDKVFNACARDAFWPRMYNDVAQYIRSCKDCQANKTPNVPPAGKLQPRDIPHRCWDVVSADFVTEFPKTKAGNDAVLVIVDKFSKQAIFTPCKKSATAPEIAQLFQDHLFAKHGVPTKIISDRDPKFTSKYWKCLTEVLNVRLNMSTADHPATDGQSENVIRTLSNMIRASIQKSPNNWDAILSILQFEYNTSVHSSTGLSPFEVELGRNSQNTLSRSLSECNTMCQQSADFAARRDAFQIVARDNLAAARARQKFYADEKRREVTFKVGDLVMLSKKGLGVSKRADLPSKWQPKYLGRLTITEVMGPVTYKITLPPSMKRAHDVVHVSKLKPYHRPDNDTGPLSIVVDADGTTEQEVLAILDKKREKRKLYYLVQFEGDPISDAVWLPRTELKNCMDLVKEYEALTRTSKSKKGRV